MKANVGSFDRILRIAVGLVLLAAVALLEGNARWLGLTGFVPLLTGIFGYCPAYAPFGFSSCPLEKKPS
jgi:hypothetical protein